MSKYITVFALLGAFLVSAPAKADYSWAWDSSDPYVGWRLEQGADYKTHPWIGGYFAFPLATVQKYGDGNGDIDLGAAHGAEVDANYTGNANRYWINFDASVPHGLAEFGIVLYGPIGSAGIPTVNGLAIGSTGIMDNLSIEVNGSWYTLASLVHSQGDDIQRQSYLDGVKTNSTAVNADNDVMVTFLYSELFGELLRQNGGFGIQVSPQMRKGFLLAVVGVDAFYNVPEPATLAIVGLGLAGLGLARRRK